MVLDGDIFWYRYVISERARECTSIGNFVHPSVCELAFYKAILFDPG